MRRAGNNGDGVRNNELFGKVRKRGDGQAVAQASLDVIRVGQANGALSCADQSNNNRIAIDNFCARGDRLAPLLPAGLSPMFAKRHEVG